MCGGGRLEAQTVRVLFVCAGLLDGFRWTAPRCVLLGVCERGGGEVVCVCVGWGCQPGRMRVCLCACLCTAWQGGRLVSVLTSPKGRC